MLWWRGVVGFAAVALLIGVGVWLWTTLPAVVSPTPTPAWTEAEQRLIQQVDDALTFHPCDDGYEAYYQQTLEAMAHFLAAPEAKNIPLARLETIWEQGAYPPAWSTGLGLKNTGLELFSSDGDDVLAAVWCVYCHTYSHMPYGGFRFAVIDRSGNARFIEGPVIESAINPYNYVRELAVYWIEDRWVALVNNNTVGMDQGHSIWHITQVRGVWEVVLQSGLLPVGNVFSCGSFEFSGFEEGYQRFTASYHCVTTVPPCEYKAGYSVYGNTQHITTAYEWTGARYQVSEETRTYTTVAIRGVEKGKETYFSDDGWKAYCQE